VFFQKKRKKLKTHLGSRWDTCKNQEYISWYSYGRITKKSPSGVLRGPPLVY